MPSDPPLPVTTVRKGPAYGGTRPLPGRTTVSLDPKGCLGEVSKTAVGAGTRLQRHDHKEVHANPKAAGYGPLKVTTRLGPDSENRRSRQRLLQKRERHEKSAFG